MTSNGKAIYRIGRFVFDPSQLLLFDGGRLIPLAPKAAQILLVLLESQGRLVEKDSLMKMIWPDCFVEEANLAVYICQLRKALNPVSANQRDPIETIPRRGYRFIGEALHCEATQNRTPDVPASEQLPQL